MQTCEYPLTWNIFLKEAFLGRLGGRHRSYHIYLGIITVFFFLLMFTGRYVVFFLVCFLVSAYFAFFHWLVTARRQYKTYAILWGGENWTRTVVFRRTSLVIAEGRSAHELGYRNIADIREKDGAATLVFGGGGALILATDGFTDGSWEQARQKVEAERQGTHRKH